MRIGQSRAMSNTVSSPVCHAGGHLDHPGEEKGGRVLPVNGWGAEKVPCRSSAPIRQQRSTPRAQRLPLRPPLRRNSLLQPAKRPADPAPPAVAPRTEARRREGAGLVVDLAKIEQRRLRDGADLRWFGCAHARGARNYRDSGRKKKAAEFCP